MFNSSNGASVRLEERDVPQDIPTPRLIPGTTVTRDEEIFLDEERQTEGGITLKQKSIVRTVELETTPITATTVVRTKYVTDRTPVPVQEQPQPPCVISDDDVMRPRDSDNEDVMRPRDSAKSDARRTDRRVPSGSVARESQSSKSSVRQASSRHSRKAGVPRGGTVLPRGVSSEDEYQWGFTQGDRDDPRNVEPRYAGGAPGATFPRYSCASPKDKHRKHKGRAIRIIFHRSGCVATKCNCL